MSKNLVVFYGRTGSTLVQHHVASRICKPEYKFIENGFTSTEIHQGETLVYYKKLKNMNYRDWCMKFHVLAGISHEALEKKQYKFWTESAEIFFKDCGVDTLHMSFRTDPLDTIASYMIAQRDKTWVVEDNHVLHHSPRNYNKDYMDQVCHSYNLTYYAYNEYYETFKDRYDMKFYPYENLGDMFDIDNDPKGMKKQLSKEEKIKLIRNYDDLVEVAKEFPFYHGEINAKTGVLET